MGVRRGAEVEGYGKKSGVREKRKEEEWEESHTGECGRKEECLEIGKNVVSREEIWLMEN